MIACMPSSRKHSAMAHPVYSAQNCGISPDTVATTAVVSLRQSLSLEKRTLGDPPLYVCQAPNAFVCVSSSGSILGPFWVHFGSILGPFCLLSEW